MQLSCTEYWELRYHAYESRKARVSYDQDMYRQAPSASAVARKQYARWTIDVRRQRIAALGSMSCLAVPEIAVVVEERREWVQ